MMVENVRDYAIYMLDMRLRHQLELGRNASAATRRRDHRQAYSRFFLPDHARAAIRIHSSSRPSRAGTRARLAVRKNATQFWRT